MEKTFNTPLSASLDENIRSFAEYTHNSSDIIVKRASVLKNRAAVFTCEGMTDAGVLADMVYRPLNALGNDASEEPGALKARLLNECLAAVDQAEVQTLGELVRRVQSGFAAIVIDGCPQAVVIGVQGYATRGIDEPTSELDVRGSREGFVEAIRTNMSMIRRRLKSPTLVFEMKKAGSRSNTDICLCYISDKASPKLLESVRERLHSTDLNTILESGYIQPFLEGKGGWFFSECGSCERPDTMIAKLYEGRVGILVDGTPFALVVPHLFIESFQTMDDYTQKPFYAAFIRLVRVIAYLITLFLPGVYVAVASYSPEMLPSSLILNLAAAEQTAPFSLMVECLFIHFMYEILREAGIRLPRPIGHAIGVVGGLVIGDITVSAGLVGAPMVLVVALSGLCSFVVPQNYEKVVVLRFLYIFAGGILGLYGLALGAGAVLIKMCSLNTYGVPYMAPVSPFSANAARDLFVRSDWRKLAKRDVRVQDLNGTDL